MANQNPFVRSLAVAWCSQIQSALEHLAQSGLRVQNVSIKVPRDTMYAINAHRDELQSHFSFLSFSSVRIYSTTYSSAQSAFKFSFELAPLTANSEQLASVIQSSPIPDAVPKLNVPIKFVRIDEFQAAKERGEEDAYRKKTEDAYLKWCKENNEKPKYI